MCYMSEPSHHQMAQHRNPAERHIRPRFESADHYVAYLKRELRKALRRGDRANRATERRGAFHWFHF